MKLYLFQSGSIRTFRHLIVGNAERGIPYEVPVPFYLIRHPRGNVLFDTGQPLFCIATATLLQKAESVVNYLPHMTEEDSIVQQLRRIGLTPVDITHIVLSHGHEDHAGGIAALHNAHTYINHREQAINPAEFPSMNWHLLEGDHDLFGDGRIRIIFTPGHTPGHQSLLLALEQWGPTLLTGDSVYTEEILAGKSLPGVMSDQLATIRTIERIQEMKKNGTRILTGHDPQVWRSLKLAPEYYE